jgi:NTP pyrophosphatase (non-canonical NTP hydrolase)
MTTAYDDFVARICKPGADIQLEANDKHLVHMLLGLAGEVGELIDALKKHLIYGQPLDVANVDEELGDIEFYLAGIRNGLLGQGGQFRDGIVAHNMAKLSRRYYAGKYTDQAAEERRDKGLTDPEQAVE